MFLVDSDGHGVSGRIVGECRIGTPGHYGRALQVIRLSGDGHQTDDGAGGGRLRGPSPALAGVGLVPVDVGRAGVGALPVHGAVTAVGAADHTALVGLGGGGGGGGQRAQPDGCSGEKRWRTW